MRFYVKSRAKFCTYLPGEKCFEQKRCRKEQSTQHQVHVRRYNDGDDEKLWGGIREIERNQNLSLSNKHFYKHKIKSCY
jgi:hypothetical protein